jgi:arylsulfatase
VAGPNILLIVSDQERQRSWLPPSVRLPWREKLIAGGLEFTNYWTHSSPCSPSRASLITGQYVPQHGVVDNVIMPEHHELDPATPTVGSIVAKAGYRSSYIGKWHLSQAASPDMAAYGYADWEGNDRHFMGWAGTGIHFDPLIASNAASWLHANGASWSILTM